MGQIPDELQNMEYYYTKHEFEFGRETKNKLWLICAKEDIARKKNIDMIANRDERERRYAVL